MQPGLRRKRKLLCLLKKNTNWGQKEGRGLQYGCVTRHNIYKYLFHSLNYDAKTWPKFLWITCVWLPSNHLIPVHPGWGLIADSLPFSHPDYRFGQCLVDKGMSWRSMAHYDWENIANPWLHLLIITLFEGRATDITEMLNCLSLEGVWKGECYKRKRRQKEKGCGKTKISHKFWKQFAGTNPQFQCHCNAQHPGCGSAYITKSTHSG